MNAPEQPLRSAVFGEIAAVIGRASAHRLVEALGGQRIYVAREIGPEHEVAQAIGAEAAAQLARFFHGTWLSLPVAASRRRQVLKLGADGNLTRKTIAARTGYSERQVYNILGADRDGQGDLFAGDDPV